MVQLLVIVAFVALHVRDAVRAGEFGSPGTWRLDVRPWACAALVLGLLAGLWLAGQLVCMSAGRRVDRSGSVVPLGIAERWIALGRLAGAVVFLVAVALLDWPWVVRGVVGDPVAFDEMVIVAPLMLMVIGGWWSFHPLDRRLREAMLERQIDLGLPVYAPPTRGQYVWSAVRHQMLMVLLPVALITAWEEGVERWLPGFLGDRRDQQWLAGVAQVAGAVAIFAVTPGLLRLIWDTAPIEGGEFRSVLESLCRRYGVRLRTPLVWRTHGAMVNGAVLGLVWPFRYMLFTDALLDRLAPRQLEAVAAHEIAHVLHRHILWIALSVIGSVLAVEALVEMVGARVGLSSQGAWATGLMGIPLVVGGVVFGWVSRRFEWQADAFAVRHQSETQPGEPEASPGAGGVVRVTPASVEWMASALRLVARINGIDAGKKGFRHGSIDDRVRRLRGIVGRPTPRLPIDAQARAIKWASALVFVLSLAALGVQAWSPPGR